MGRVLRILEERKIYFEKRRPHLVSLIGLRDLERFIHTGMVGRLGLPVAVRALRIAAARREVLRIADLMENQPLHVQLGLINEAMPASTFQLFIRPQRTVVVVSPFRFGEPPNIRNGIATVTASADAVRMHRQMIDSLWKTAYKGIGGARRLHRLLDSIH